jgi:small GTP-binding protein
MLARILDDVRRDLLKDERRSLSELRDLLDRLDAPAEDQEALARSIAQLDELFLLVVVGEFNSGKSALINALLGRTLLEEGVTPTTSRIAVLKHGQAVGRAAAGAGLEIVTAPEEILREINVVDTPGTNAVLRGHEALTRDFVPRADLVIFVTSAERPFTESERGFLETIRDWGKKVVVVVNKADILETPEERTAVVEFVREQALALLGLRPEVFVVSARKAGRGKADADEAAVAASGLPELEAFLARRLDEAERLRLKLLNPLGVALRVRERAFGTVSERLELLKDDVATLEAIDGQLAVYREDLARDFRFRVADVEKVLLEFEARGNAFFDETLRLGRIRDLLRRDKVRQQFERDVVADLPRTIESRVEQIVDWLVASELAQWQAIAEQLVRRQAAHAARLVGGAVGTFERDRTRLLESVRREAQQAVASYDHAAEARRLGETVRETVAGAALLQVGALGLGAVVAAFATTTFADVTGILAAGALSVMGLLVLPARRARARRELRAKVATMREKLMGSLTQSFEAELTASQRRILDAIAPYSRFVRSEADRLRGQRGELAALHDALEVVKGRVEALA